MKGNEVDVVILGDEIIAACIGCFGCWLRTPGKCVIMDTGRELPKKLMESDVVFLLTPVTFGMYSSELKKAIDRVACPILLPFFKKINDEIHHSKRYEVYPSLVSIGVLPNPDKESENIFRTLVERNGINLHSTAIARFVYSKDKPDVIKEKIFSTLSEVDI